MVGSNAIQTGFANMSGGRLCYELAGQGPAVVFAHAGIADQRMWDDQFLVFAEHYRVVRFDFRGFGKSTTENSTFYFHEDLHELLMFLGIEKAHLVGCSLGGRVTIDVALAYPQMVKSLIVVGSGLSGYRFGGEVLMRFQEQIIAARQREDNEQEVELRLRLWVDGQGRTPNQVDPQFRERARQMLLGRPGIQGEGKQLEPPAIERLSEIHVPTLIIIGDREEANILTIADLLAENIAGARKVIIPNTAHLPNMERPQEFNRRILEFLRSNS